MSDIPPAYIIDDMAKGGMGRTSGNKSYLENYGGGKASNKVPPFANRENIHRNNSTQNYEFKSQNNGSNGSNSGGGGSKKNIEPPVKDNWNFNSEIPKTAVKNSEGNYTLGRGNEWSVNNTVTSVKRISENQNNIYNVELNNGMTPGYTLIRKSDIKVTIDEKKVNAHQNEMKLGKNRKSPLEGGHTVSSFNNYFMNEVLEIDLEKQKVINIPKILIQQNKAGENLINDLGNGITEFRYLKLREKRNPKTGIMEPMLDDFGKPSYREILNLKTVIDTDIHNIEELTREVLSTVQKTITQDDVDRAVMKSIDKKNAQLDITVKNIPIKVYIKANVQNGEIIIENYHVDSEKLNKLKKGK